MAIYHRKLSKTQTLSTAIWQVHSREVWGTVPRHGEFACVQAWVGPLQPDDTGIEFETDTPVTPNSSTPSMAYWLEPQAFVVPLASGVDSEYVGIRVSLRKIIYRSSKKAFNVECVFPTSSSIPTNR